MNKTNMIFSSLGDKSIFYNYWLGSYINYDVYINYIGNNSNDELKWRNNVKKIYNQSGFSFNVLNNLYKNKEIDLEKYKYIAILDENINLQRYDISICFELMENHQLYFGSPTIEKNTNSQYKEILYTQKNNKLRFTNYVNLDICFIKSEILIEFFNNYNNELEDYGFEYLLFKNYIDMRDKMGLFDLVPYNNINYIEKNKEDSKIVFEKMELLGKVKTYNIEEYDFIGKKTLEDIKKTNDKFIIVKENTNDTINNNKITKKVEKNIETIQKKSQSVKKNTNKMQSTKVSNNINKKFYKTTIIRNLTKKTTIRKATAKQLTKKKTTHKSVSKKVEKNRNKRTYAKIKLL